MNERLEIGINEAGNGTGNEEPAMPSIEAQGPPEQIQVPEASLVVVFERAAALATAQLDAEPGHAMPVVHSASDAGRSFASGMSDVAHTEDASVMPNPEDAKREKARERARRWRETHPEAYHASQKRWQETHREQWNAYRREYRKRKKQEQARAVR